VVSRGISVLLLLLQYKFFFQVWQHQNYKLLIITEECNYSYFGILFGTIYDCQAIMKTCITHLKITLEMIFQAEKIENEKS
jgi:hypothetical protein